MFDNEEMPETREKKTKLKTKKGDAGRNLDDEGGWRGVGDEIDDIFGFQ